MLKQLLEALGYLHGHRYGRQNRWCHGDVKPLNIWIRSDALAANIRHWASIVGPFVKLGDLGLVTEKAGTFFAGTPAYEAPEQRERNKASPASDVFAAGQTLVDLITGSTLTEWELKSQKRISDKLAGHVCPALSTVIAALVRKMTYTAPTMRATAREAAEQTSGILVDDREWMVVETFAAIAPDGLSLKDASNALFERFAEWEGWTNRTDARLATIKELLKDMYQSGILMREGHKYSVQI